MKNEWKLIKATQGLQQQQPTFEEVKWVQAIQEKMYTEKTSLVESFMDALKRINREHLEEVVLERASQDTCGLPVCGNTVSRQKSRIIDGEIVSDELVGCFCCTKCYQIYYKCKESISIIPFHLRKKSETTKEDVVLVREVRAPVLKKK